jgi:hypothetical protein
VVAVKVTTLQLQRVAVDRAVGLPKVVKRVVLELQMKDSRAVHLVLIMVRQAAAALEPQGRYL